MFIVVTIKHFVLTVALKDIFKLAYICIEYIAISTNVVKKVSEQNTYILI